MVYAVTPFIVLGALGYMFWRAALHMRRDRVWNERRAMRGRHAFTRFHRARFLLGKAFGHKTEEPDWQVALRRRLDEVNAGRGGTLERLRRR